MGNKQSRSEILFLANELGELREYKIKNYEKQEVSFSCNCNDVAGNMIWNYGMVTDHSDFLIKITSDYKFIYIATSQGVDKYNTISK